MRNIIILAAALFLSTSLNNYWNSTNYCVGVCFMWTSMR